VLIQGVGTVFSPPLRVPLGTGTPGRVVVITRDMAPADLHEACAPHGVRISEG
jgi:hypothetical protein